MKRGYCDEYENKHVLIKAIITTTILNKRA